MVSPGIIDFAVLAGYSDDRTIRLHRSGLDQWETMGRWLGTAQETATRLLTEFTLFLCGLPSHGRALSWAWTTKKPNSNLKRADVKAGLERLREDSPVPRRLSEGCERSPIEACRGPIYSG